MLQVVTDGTSSGDSEVSLAQSVTSPNKASPYSDMIALRCTDGVLFVHRFKLETMPKLHSLVSPHHELNILGVSAAAGHVLVNFLYKGYYDVALSWNAGRVTKTRDAELLRCSFDVYATARQYDIDSLAILAQDDIESRTVHLEPAEALAAVKKACPLPDTKDEWLRNYTKTLLNAAYPSIEAFLTSTIMAADHAEETMSITEMLLRTVISSTMERELEEKTEREAVEEAARAELRPELEALEAKKTRRGNRYLNPTSHPHPKWYKVAARITGLLYT
ncbi:uncharacterized protein B0I36DRAFT_368806 [Microdochium trichocladiopsis]|uniref:BTB domain-containing protein n=1 Tax=Microdochium trichocladiopsis TaxID=1682393 RepID=A0A9P8XW79_9PEZI|nr:uncharacterized protein B0I36DRAFT_368806 [Microdochium trichocladiopsis]KAH7016221.1 hypothetical protein B0I36DRAFT_368806 [Microdochium trichocladiopsis]